MSLLDGGAMFKSQGEAHPDFTNFLDHISLIALIHINYRIEDTSCNDL